MEVEKTYPTLGLPRKPCSEEYQWCKNNQGLRKVRVTRAFCDPSKDTAEENNPTAVESTFDLFLPQIHPFPQMEPFMTKHKLSESFNVPNKSLIPALPRTLRMMDPLLRKEVKNELFSRFLESLVCMDSMATRVWVVPLSLICGANPSFLNFAIATFYPGRITRSTNLFFEA
jgi:hypothetical protein